MNIHHNTEQYFTKEFTQTKQRIDLEVHFDKKRIIGTTKLTFIKKPEAQHQKESTIPPQSQHDLILKLNAENMTIKDIYIYNSNKNLTENSDPLISKQSKLKYTYINPNKTQDYLNKLYQNLEDIDSVRNLNRIDWETRQEGNLEIIINSSNLLLNDNIFKICIDYELNEKFIGVVFQSFYDEKNDVEYEVCYTPNFYFNTCNWVPCIYDLKLQIGWKKYIIVDNDYSAYSSCLLSGVFQDTVKNKKAFYYKSKEPLCAKNIGFIILCDKIFNRIEDPSNKNIFYVINETKRERLEKNIISNGLMNAVYNYYEEFFESEANTNSNFNSSSFIVFIPYLAINSFNSTNFEKYFSVMDENYFNIIKFPNLYILPEKVIYDDSIPDIMEFQLKNISKLFITNYIGGLITELSYSDFWLINGIENWLSDNFLLKCYGNNYLKHRLNKYLKKFKRFVKEGKEKRPLYTNNFSHPAELQFDPLVYLKSTITIHLLEAQVEKDFVKKALKNIINERFKNGYNISTESFIKIFKKNCGINLKHFMQLWVFKTGMLELILNYSYNKRTNSIDLELFQKPVTQNFYEQNPHFKIKDINFETLEKLNKNLAVVDFKVKPLRYFDVGLNLLIYQTNGIEIMMESHQVKLETERDSIFQNFPLNTKIRKAPMKKREQEFIQDLISNTSIGKIYSNEEIEKILTNNSIMWVKADPEINLIRNVNVVQQHILYDYIKLFKEGDVIGQYESLRNIYKHTPQENFQNSLIILETFIRSLAYYKIRLYAIKIYLKIIHKMRIEEGYMFLLDYLEDCWIEILKNKTNLNRDTYFVLTKIIKYLGNYREDYFNDYFVIGRVINSQIQNKIIDKFLTILTSNDLNTINGLNYCYITREISIGCAKLNLQEKTFFLLKKIVKCLRIEKLKRSFNEIVIISCIQAFLIVLIKNDFFNESYSNSHYDNHNIKIIVGEILEEVNHFISTDCENYELNVFLYYFQIYLIFYRSKNFLQFVNNIHPLFFSYNDADIEMKIDGYADNQNKSHDLPRSSYVIKDDENLFAKLLALEYLILPLEFSLENINEKVEILNFVKEIWFSKHAYLRVDVRNSAEKLFTKILNVPIVEAIPDNIESNNFNYQSDNILFNSMPQTYQANINIPNILQNLNKNFLNFAGRKYADEDWLYAFAHADKRENDYISAGDAKNLYSEMSSETQSRFGSKQISLIKKYQSKYPSDSYAIFNCNLDLENKPWLNSCYLIIDKLIHHPFAYPFCLPLNKETLGDLFEQYHSLIKFPIDLQTIRIKLDSGEYPSMNEFNSDVLLVFSNCRDFNLKGSELHSYANQLEEFFKILIEPVRKRNLETIIKNEIPEIKIKLQGEELTDGFPNY